MIQSLWHLIFFQPLYNALVYLIGLIPGGDVGVAVIVLTIVVRIVLFPIAKKSIVSQVKLRNLQPELDRIKKEYPDKQEQSKQTFALYKEHKVNPFSGCLLVLIQLPIIIALYRVFLGAFSLEGGQLYSFVTFPATFNTHFLGFVDIHQKNLVIALLAGISQFIQIWLTLPKQQKKTTDEPATFQNQLAKSMNFQMKYFLPIFVTVIAYQVSGAVALYWVTSNVFTIGQEILIRRKMAAQSGTKFVKAKVAA